VPPLELECLIARSSNVNKNYASMYDWILKGKHRLDAKESS
jgi:hypothetical protein